MDALSSIIEYFLPKKSISTEVSCGKASELEDILPEDPSPKISYLQDPYVDLTRIDLDTGITQFCRRAVTLFFRSEKVTEKSERNNETKLFELSWTGNNL